MLIVSLLALSVGTGAAASDPAEKGLYQDSIKSTKQSIVQDTLKAFYQDALDDYREGRLESALAQLDKIYSIDPHYQDVAELRTTVRKKLANSQSEASNDDIRDWMKKGNEADHQGLKAAAIANWKKALEINPQYAPAQKKIDAANQALARREFEAGYIHYRHGEMEDALDSWSNAIALDPTYKQKGLLMLMSKVQLQIERDQTTRLASQGYEQYQQGNLEAALATYQELLKQQPRNEEAHRYTSKIKIQLSQNTLKAAREALAAHHYAEAVELSSKTMDFGYFGAEARKIKSEAEGRQTAMNHHPTSRRPPSTPKPPPHEPAAQPAPTTAPPPTAKDPEGAMVHYRQGMAAMRKQDYHVAVDELDSAYQLDPTNEHIYMARERAKQQWMQINSGHGAP